MVDALGARTGFTYDAAGNRLTVKDAAGDVSTSRYDAAGHLVEMQDALGGVIRREYDAEGRVATTTDARGNRTQIQYDALGRMVGIVSADGSTTTFGYCSTLGGGTGSGDEPCGIIDAVGGARWRELDAKGHVLVEVDPLGRKTQRAYDTAGRLRSISGPWQVDTTYSHGSNGLLTSVTASTQTVVYEYDARGNRSTINAEGQVTSFEYDAANRLIAETNPLGVVTRYEYDAVGNRVAKVDGNGRRTTYTYDANRRLRSVTFNDGSAYQYAYDERGNRTREKSANHERTFAYDALNRLAETVDVSLGRTLTYSYDANNNRTEVRSGEIRQAYAYDALNRLRHVVDASGKPIVFSYDVLGRRTAITRPNGVTSSYEYDAAGQVLNIVHSREQHVLVGFAYEYDTQGNRVSKTSADGSKETYSYDSNDRLVQVDYGTQRSVHYELDKLGNHIQMTETTPSMTRVSSYQHNAFNQLLQATEAGKAIEFIYDRNGNLLNENKIGQVRTYGWDLDNRLRQELLPAGMASTFEYDATGLRVRKTDAAGTTRYLLDGPSVIEEFGENNAPKAIYASNPKRLDEILSANLLVGGQPASLYPLTDALGSICALTDENGSVVGTYSYDVYGTRERTSGSLDPSFGFIGREHEGSGLLYLRNRFYSGQEGRFLTPDRLTFGFEKSRGRQAEQLGAFRKIPRASGVNLYAYAEGSPTMNTDPSGLWVLWGLTGFPGYNVEWWSPESAEGQELQRIYYDVVAGMHWEFAFPFAGSCEAHASGMVLATRKKGLLYFKAKSIAVSPIPPPTAPYLVHYVLLLEPSPYSRNGKVFADTYLWASMNDFEPDDHPYIRDE